jgi:hypothetical protein
VYYISNTYIKYYMIQAAGTRYDQKNDEQKSEFREYSARDMLCVINRDSVVYSNVKTPIRSSKSAC